MENNNNVFESLAYATFAAQAQNMGVSCPAEKQGFYVAGFIVGIFGIILGLFIPIAGIILGNVARQMAGKNEEVYSVGAARVCGTIGIVIGVVLWGINIVGMILNW